MTTIKTDYGFVLIGPCLICGTEITNEEGKEIDCYNEECREYRRNLVVPEGWIITPFEKGFKYPSDAKELSLEEQIEKLSCGWTDEQLAKIQATNHQRMRKLVEDLEVKDSISHQETWARDIVVLFLIFGAVILMFYLFRWLV